MAAEHREARHRSAVPPPGRNADSSLPPRPPRKNAPLQHRARRAHATALPSRPAPPSRAEAPSGHRYGRGDPRRPLWQRNTGKPATEAPSVPQAGTPTRHYRRAPLGRMRRYNTVLAAPTRRLCRRAPRPPRGPRRPAATATAAAIRVDRYGSGPPGGPPPKRRPSPRAGTSTRHYRRAPLGRMCRYNTVLAAPTRRLCRRVPRPPRGPRTSAATRYDSGDPLRQRRPAASAIHHLPVDVRCTLGHRSPGVAVENSVLQPFVAW